MEIEFLTGGAVESAVKRLMADYDEFHWAVAWGTSTSLSQNMIFHRAKISAVTFGLAFAHTDPDLVAKLVGVKGCYVVTKFPGGTFHPKVW